MSRSDCDDMQEALGRSEELSFVNVCFKGAILLFSSSSLCRDGQYLPFSLSSCCAKRDCAAAFTVGQVLGFFQEEKVLSSERRELSKTAQREQTNSEMYGRC